MLDIVQIPVLNDNYIYLLHDTASGLTAAVDPAVADAVIDAIDAREWRLDFILNTHHHGDHVGGNRQLKQRTGCRVVGSKTDRERIPGIDIEVGDGDVFRLGETTFDVIDTPGHTNGHVVYYSAEEGVLFCGDTLFAMGCGRLFEGTAEAMWASLQKLKALPGSTRVYCAHEYTLNNGRFALTIEPENAALQNRTGEVMRLRSENRPTVPFTMAEELATNPFLRADTIALQTSLNMTDQPAVAVFAEVRARKDRF
ncbi:MAG: hydroxyacylglutathione hydrolase [Methylomicrobium sp.]